MLRHVLSSFAFLLTVSACNFSIFDAKPHECTLSTLSPEDRIGCDGDSLRICNQQCEQQPNIGCTQSIEVHACPNGGTCNMSDRGVGCVPPNVQKTCAHVTPLAIPSPGDPAVADTPSAALITDVNKDGQADLVVIADPFIDVYLRGPAGLAPSLAPQAIGKHIVTERAYAADIDGNGTVDLVLESGASDVFQIMLGTGDGTFVVGESHPLHKASQGELLGVGDLDHDGRADVVALDSDASDTANIHVFFATAKGALTTGPSTRIAATAGKGRGFGDFDGDGAHGAILAAPGNTFTRITLKEDGTATASPIAIDSAGLQDLVTGDFDGDGKIDVAAMFDGKIVVLHNTGSSTFAPIVRSYDAEIFATPEKAFVGDVNGDRRDDLVTWGFGRDDDLGAGDVFDVWHGAADSGLEAPHAIALWARGGIIAVGDLDGDGAADAVFGGADIQIASRACE